MIAAGIRLAERLPLPDALARGAIRLLVARTDRGLRRLDAQATEAFARDMAGWAIAEHTDAANAQHYELPASFFAHVLGPHMKYSSCFYAPGDRLASAEERALALTAGHARLRDGQRILELGCGWGSLSLWMAERYPGAQILAVSNSASQKAHIMMKAGERGLRNLTVHTADINVFEPEATFDRIVSVEMFEHLSNWRAILQRMRFWLVPEGRAFLHVFSHEAAPYRFDHRNQHDFIAQHFFTGGIMPSHDLIGQFDDCFAIEKEWRWNGTHYAATARDWLANYDANRASILPVLSDVYGSEAAIWDRRWRLFFLATAGLFGYRGGMPWGVSHYLLRAP